MGLNGKLPKITAPAIWLGVGVMIVSSGCKSSPSAPPDPPSGGQEYILDYDVFLTDVSPVLTDRGCDSIACHGGGIRGTFQLSPSDDKNANLDFSQVSLQVTPSDPASSPILMKPLAPEAGGDVHTADPELSGFMSVNDKDYQAILSWIEAGEYR